MIRLRGRVTAMAALGGLLMLVPSAFATTRPAAIEPRAATAAVNLVSQTPTVPRGGTFEVWVQLPAIPDDGSVELVLHGRVRSRSELAASMEGNALRGEIYSITTPIVALPVATDGSRRLALSLDPTTAGGVALTSAGAYPVEINAQDAAGAVLASATTHLLVRPDDADTSPRLAVAVVVRVDAAPALQPSGSIELDDGDLADSGALVAALAGEPDVPATVAVRPETLDALASSTDPERVALLAQLRLAVEGRQVLALPYVDTSPDALNAAGLIDELDHQLERGRAVLVDRLGTRPTLTSWIAGPDLDLPGLSALQEAGARHLVVSPEQVAPLRSGLLSLSLAQPFLIGADRQTAADAIALDPRITDRIGTKESPGLEVSRLLAELAVLWFEQPGIARAVVVPVDSSVRGEVVQGVLAGLASGGMFAAAPLDDLFATASPLRQAGGGPVDRALVPDSQLPIGAALTVDLLAVRPLLTSFAALVGPDSPRLEAASAHVLLATATRLRTAVREEHLDAARAAIDDVAGKVTAPSHETITLTARDGTVPLTVGNASGVPVHVVVHLRSSKLEFPDGNTIPLTLTDSTKRLDIAVRTRASGTFPLDVTITSPDGALTLATVAYSVQSTAVSGVGLVLSIGAAIFLMVWWARHWRRTRRSAKLVSATNPAHAPKADSGKAAPP